MRAHYYGSSRISLQNIAQAVYGRNEGHLRAGGYQASRVGTMQPGIERGS